MRLWLAIRVFFAVLFDSRLAAQAQDLLQKPGETSRRPGTLANREATTDAAGMPVSSQTKTPGGGRPPKPPRSDALTLLAALQREARFVDIVQEPLSQYTDAQIGAAARDVLRDCGSVLERVFAIRPLVNDDEGAELVAPADFDANRYRLTGHVVGEPPFKGRLVHHGWQATRCDLPTWSGSDQAAMVVAPIELEMRSNASS